MRLAAPVETLLFTVAVAAGVLLVAFGAYRRHRVFQGEMRRWRERHPVGADGIVPGAGAIALDGGERAVLLLHGFGDTPQTLERLARALYANGWTVRAPLLPGHGRTLEAFHASRGAEWTATARDAFDRLRATHDRVAIVGLSMGGALATSLAVAVGARAVTLVLLAPFLGVATSGRLLTAAWPLWSLWRAWVPGDAASAIHDPAARRESLGYGVASPRALRELRGIVDDASRACRQLQIPTLVVHSRTDYRIPAGDRRARVRPAWCPRQGPAMGRTQRARDHRRSRRRGGDRHRHRVAGTICASRGRAPGQRSVARGAPARGAPARGAPARHATRRGGAEAGLPAPATQVRETSAVVYPSSQHVLGRRDAEEHAGGRAAGAPSFPATRSICPCVAVSASRGQELDRRGQVWW